MSGLYRERAVVLRTYRLGESDRIVVLLTAGRGKVRAVAKGVRKTKSRFGARLEPPSHIAVQMYEGRELDVVTQAEAIDSFRYLRDDLNRLGAALAMLEAVDQIAVEAHADPRLQAMLVGALRTLEPPADTDSPAGAPDGKEDTAGRDSAAGLESTADEPPAPGLVVAGFYWKLLAHDGAGPILDGCARCGDEASPLVAFDLLQGGALCRSCRSGTAMTSEALDVVRQMLGGRLGVALRSTPGHLVEEVAGLATGALEEHLERRLRAVRLSQ